MPAWFPSRLPIGATVIVPSNATVNAYRITDCLNGCDIQLNGGTTAGTDYDQLSVNGTIDVTGATYPRQINDRVIDPLQGKSLLPVFRGETRKPHETMYFHFGTDRALRQGPWKLVSAKLGKWELYNLADDLGETTNLATKRPEQTAELLARLADWRQAVGAQRGHFGIDSGRTALRAHLVDTCCAFRARRLEFRAGRGDDRFMIGAGPADPGRV